MAPSISVATTTIPSQLSKLYFPVTSSFFDNCNNRVRYSPTISYRYIHIQHHLCQSRVAVRPIFAVGSGVGASNADSKGYVMSFKDAKIVVESQEDDKIQLRVDLTGDDTQKVFNKALMDLARTAPPIPGFRKQKGGKTSKVPQDFLLQMLGQDRVTKFVIQEIIMSTTADYVEKENLNVKENKINTTQKEDELKKMFKPGYEFGFNVVLELEEPKSESATSS